MTLESGIRIFNERKAQIILILRKSQTLPNEARFDAEYREDRLALPVGLHPRLQQELTVLAQMVQTTHWQPQGWLFVASGSTASTARAWRTGGWGR